MIKGSCAFKFSLENSSSSSEIARKIYRENFFAEGSNAFEEKRKKSGGMEYSVSKEKTLQGAVFCIIMK